MSMWFNWSILLYFGQSAIYFLRCDLKINDIILVQLHLLNKSLANFCGNILSKGNFMAKWIVQSHSFNKVYFCWWVWRFYFVSKNKINFKTQLPYWLEVVLRQSFTYHNYPSLVVSEQAADSFGIRQLIF